MTCDDKGANSANGNPGQTHWDGCDCSRQRDRRDATEAAIRHLMAEWDIGIEEGEDVVAHYLAALGYTP